MSQHFEFSTINLDLLEYIPCPLCSTDKPNPKKQFIFEPFRVVQCTSCRLWYLSPRLREEEMLKVYADPNYFKGGSEFGYSHQQGSYLEQAESLRLTFRKFLHQLNQRGMTGGDLLEVGCGYGFLQEEAAPLFDSLTATDFDSEAVKRINQLGYQGIQGGLEALPTGQSYDLIISMGVIEHIYEPTAWVKKLSQHLKPTGWLILSTPPMNSFWLKLQGKNWPSFKIPEHVIYYDRHTLTKLFHQCGAIQTRILNSSYAYPLGMITEKLGISVPTALAKYSIWLPATMFVIAARFNP
jgi:SAM-dependent methyltransferase